MRASLVLFFTAIWLVPLTGCHLIFPFDLGQAGPDAANGDAADDLARKDGAGDRLQSIEMGEDDAIASKDASPLTGWSVSFGGPSTDSPFAVAVDNQDNVYITGHFSQSVGFPGGASFISHGMADAIIVSYSSTGTYRWAKAFGGLINDSGLDIAVDSAGDIVVVGTVGSTVTFCNKTLSGLGGQDIFLAKLDQSGSCKWLANIGGNQADYGYGVAVDPANNIFLTGRIDSITTQGTKPTLTPFGGSDIFLGRYSPTGEAIWSKALGGTGSDIGWSVAMNASGSYLYVTGSFSSTAEFHGKKLTSNDVDDLFVASYMASDGDYRWAESAGSTGTDWGTAISTDSKGNVFVTGFAWSSIFGKATASSQDIFAARYSPLGNLVWGDVMGSTKSDRGSALTVDSSGNLLLAGYISGVVALPSGSIGKDSMDVVLVRMDPSGAYLGGTSYGENGADFAQDVATDSSGAVIIVGNFGSEIDLGHGQLKSHGEIDAFIAKVPSP